MKNMLQKWLAKYVQFMQGRYGMYGQDSLSSFLLITALVLDLIGVLSHHIFVVWISLGLLIWMICRMYSKNIVKRSMENAKFRDMTAGIRHCWQAAQKNRTDQTYKYFVCPKCGQTVRVPRGRGQIEITCPKCGKTFTRKS